MKAVNFKRAIRDKIAYRLGIDPAQDINRDHVAAWVAMANDCIDSAFTYWQWPQLEIAEERAFRVTWKATRQFKLGDECFYVPTISYYKAIATPPIGTLPTDTNYFQPATITNRYIAYEQPGKRPIDQAIGVYYGNPDTNCMFGLKFWPSQNGIQLNGYGGPTVFVKYRIKAPEFTSESWEPGTAYAKNDLVYFNDDGECYQALTANTNQSPAAVPANWRKMLMPDFLAPYVAYQVASEASDDAASAQRWAGAAQDWLIGEVNKLLEQGQPLRYSIRRPHCYPYGYPLGTSGFVWSISPPWTSDTLTTTLTDEDDPFSEEANTMLEDGLTQINNGDSFVDVAFQSWTGGAGYSIDEMLVQNFVDSPPIEIYPTILVSKRADGFRYLLNAAPDNNNYFFKWRIVP